MPPRKPQPPKIAPGQTWRPLFERFIANLEIDSKEALGPMKLGDHLYGAQKRFVDEVIKGLEEDVRFFVTLKARQLGLSTISLAIDLFWLIVFDGTQGALITDTTDNLANFRRIIERYLKSLPKNYKIPIKTHNRALLEFTNGSVLQYLVAGTRGSKNLGTSRALNFVHATEVAKWGDSAGITSLMATLAERHPNRLYIWETTAQGHNHFYDMWQKANEDTDTQRAIFIGWWAKEAYRIDKSDKRYERYMADPPTPEEIEKAEIVRDAYGWHVEPEQLCWYRWWSATRAEEEGAMEENYPWHESEAFVVTGAHFFPAKRLAADLKAVMSGAEHYKFAAFRYIIGEEFTQTELDVLQMEQVTRSALAELRIWDRPVEHGVYTVGVDPAYGRTDWGDQHCISVWRCYADKLIQVAEYATDMQETYQIIWVLAHLAAMYRNCRINLEINGPGAAVMQGLKHIKAQLRAMAPNKGEPDYPRTFLDALGAARWFLFHRPDSLGSGYVYNWRTQADNKFQIMNQMRDSYVLGNLLVRSGPMLQQMETIVQDNGDIGASGHGKDDRVFAACFAHYAWLEWERRGLIDRGRTLAQVTEDERIAAEKGARPQGNSLVGQIVRNTIMSARARRAEEDRRRAIGGRFAV